MSPNRRRTTRVTFSSLPAAPRFGPIAVAGRHAVVAATLLASALWGCREQSNAGPMQYGTESHFLTACERDADCGELRCFDGVCSLPCTGDSECTRLHAGSTCLGSADSSLSLEKSCVLECSGDAECDGSSTSCVGGYCGGHGPSDGPASPTAPSGEGGSDDPDDATDDPATDDPATDDVTPMPPEAGTTAPSVSPGAEAGTPTPVPFEGGTSTPNTPSSEAGGPSPDPNTPDASPSDPIEPGIQSCATHFDCVLATRIDECCPGCPQAVSVSYAEAEACVYAEGEAEPVGCEAIDCTDGCPGAACGEVVGAVCAAETCALQANTTNCGSCASGEICTFDPSSGLYECIVETCEYDRCHPDRCDQIGEACCDPLPGDGPNYCNGGLTCGPSGCEVPAAAAPERVCGTLLCPEGEVCCDKCEELCVSELSGAGCPDDGTPDRVCGG